MPLPPPTERVEFRRWQPEDTSLAASLWCDPQVMRFLGGPYTEEEVTARLEREIANDATHGVQYWPLFARRDGEFAGCCGLKPHEPAQRFFEIGFHLRPKFWGAGLATEAARTVIEYAFEELSAVALFAGHHPENHASAAMLANLQFVRIGTHFFARTALEHPWYRRWRPGTAATAV